MLQTAIWLVVTITQGSVWLSLYFLFNISSEIQVFCSVVLRTAIWLVVIIIQGLVQLWFYFLFGTISHL